MQKQFVVGIFEDETNLVHAAENIVEKGIDIYDIYTPFPVHGLDELLKIKRTRLPYVTFLAGGVGLSCALALQIWTSAVDWPLNISGKPYISTLAFIPISFELTVLFGALTTVLMFFVAAKLFPTKKPVLFDLRQTDYTFVLAVEKTGNVNEGTVTEIFKKHGATNVFSKSEDFEACCETETKNKCC